jgi:hypothetical protein
VDFALEQPAYGQVRVSNEMKKRAISISPVKAIAAETNHLAADWSTHVAFTWHGGVRAAPSHCTPAYAMQRNGRTNGWRRDARCDYGAVAAFLLKMIEERTEERSIQIRQADL